MNNKYSYVNYLYLDDSKDFNYILKEIQEYIIITKSKLTKNEKIILKH